MFEELRQRRAASASLGKLLQSINIIEDESEGHDRYLYNYADNPSALKREFTRWFNKNIGQFNGDLESYNFDLEPNDPNQSRIGRNNMLFDLMYNRLLDPDSMKDRFTPGGFSDIEEASAKMREYKGIESKKYDYSDPYTLIEYNQQNQVAGKLIAIFANHNANAAITSLVDTLRLKESIKFGDHLNGLDDLKNPDSLVMELLAASVDAVKNPCLKDLGVNLITSNATAMLARLGYSYEEIGLLFNQPVIANLVKEANNKGLSDITEAINTKLGELEAASDNINDVALTTKLMIETIQGKDNSIDAQVAALKLFKTIYAAASELNQYSSDTRFTASNSVKATFGGMYAQEMKVAKSIDTLKGSKTLDLNIGIDHKQEVPILLGLDINDPNYFRTITNNPFGYEQVQFDAQRAMLKAIANYFPYEAMSGIRDKSLYIINGTPTDKTVDSLHKIVIKHLLARAGDPNVASKFDPEGEIEFQGEIMTMKDYYSKVIPLKIIRTLKAHPELAESNGLLGLLTTSTDKDGNTEIKFSDNGALMEDEKLAIQMGWKELLNEWPQMAEDIYMYNYYKSGTGFGIVGFNHLTPTDVLLSLDNGNYIRNLYDMLYYDREDMLNHVVFEKLAREFTIANANNYQVVYSVPDSLLEKMKTGKNNRNDAEGVSAIFNPNKPNTWGTITISPNEGIWTPFMIKRGNGDADSPNYFKAGFKIKMGDKTLLYVASNGSNFNKTFGDEPMTYELVRDDEGNPVNIDDVTGYGDSEEILAQQVSSDDSLGNDRYIDFGVYDSSLSDAALQANNERLARKFVEEINKVITGPKLSFDMIREQMLAGENDEAKRKDFENLKAGIIDFCRENGFKGKIDNEEIC